MYVFGQFVYRKSKEETTAKRSEKRACTCTCKYNVQVNEVVTEFARIVTAATINFSLALVQLLFEGGSHSRAATINYKQVA